MAISKEFQSAYQRWEMTSFDARPVRAESAPAPSQANQMPSMPGIQPPTVEELEAIHVQAHEEGYAEGLAAGQQAGQEAGYEAGLASGHAAGHAGGFEEGLAQGRAAAAEELARLREIAGTFGDAVARADEGIAQDVLDLALHLAKNMVRTAFEVKPELILAVVREAIDYLPTLQQPALLTLHPDDALIVKSSIGAELDKSGWRVIEDASIARGGCRVDTASNQIDSQIAGRWQRLTQALGRDVEWLG
jgi:flagellar assembly protein FliH